jgi:hypothetical protein
MKITDINELDDKNKLSVRLSYIYIYIYIYCNVICHTQPENVISKSSKIFYYI